jgi:uncharacterized protein YndB with AHSA1/START domain
MTEPLPPIRRQVDVSWSQDEAFRRFTADFPRWWPRHTHSIGGRMVKEVVFECRPGGRIFEEFADGRRFQWGTVTKWEAPRLLAFTWHPSRDASEAQEVEISFTPTATGTEVVLTSAGWEKYGDKARRERKGYDIGWGAVLATWAGRWSFAQTLFGLVSRGATAYLRMTGKLGASIAKAGGRMSDSAAST